MRLLVIQPHLDDAFFSITETAMTWVEDGHEVLLSTVFGGIPSSVGDNERYWKHTRMWEEYEAALRRGPFSHVAAGPFLDDAARTDQLMLKDVAAFIERQISDCNPDVVVVPTGIHHPDHEVTTSAHGWARHERFRRRDKLAQFWIYDELPYFAMHPHLAHDPDGDDGVWWEREGSRSHLAEKQAICREFASQVGENEERHLWCSERVWRPR